MKTVPSLVLRTRVVIILSWNKVKYIVKSHIDYYKPKAVEPEIGFKLLLKRRAMNLRICFIFKSLNLGMAEKIHYSCIHHLHYVSMLIFIFNTYLWLLTITHLQYNREDRQTNPLHVLSSFLDVCPPLPFFPLESKNI